MLLERETVSYATTSSLAHIMDTSPRAAPRPPAPRPPAPRPPNPTRSHSPNAEVSSAADAMLKLSSSLPVPTAIVLPQNIAGPRVSRPSSSTAAMAATPMFPVYHQDSPPPSGQPRFVNMLDDSAKNAHSSGTSATTTQQLPRNSRKQREFIPDFRKDEHYWSKRKKNNEAAKRSREKRRFNDLQMSDKISELMTLNSRLRRELKAIKQKFGLPTSVAFPVPDDGNDSGGPSRTGPGDTPSDSDSDSSYSGATMAHYTNAGSVHPDVTGSEHRALAGDMGGPQPHHHHNLPLPAMLPAVYPAYPPTLTPHALASDSPSKQVPVYLSPFPLHAFAAAHSPRQFPILPPEHVTHENVHPGSEWDPSARSRPPKLLPIYATVESPDRRSDSSSPGLKIVTPGQSPPGSDTSDPSGAYAHAIARHLPDSLPTLHALPTQEGPATSFGGLVQAHTPPQTMYPLSSTRRKGVPFKLWHKLCSHVDDVDDITDVHNLKRSMSNDNGDNNGADLSTGSPAKVSLAESSGQRMGGCDGADDGSLLYDNSFSGDSGEDNHNPLYTERRQRNNVAARKCRENRKVLNEMRMVKSTMLESENDRLRDELNHLHTEMHQLRQWLDKKKEVEAKGQKFTPPPLEDAGGDQSPSKEDGSEAAG